MRMQEGKQYFVNRITFRATRRPATTSSAARCGCYENGVFNTEALKYSVKRLNQLGYFKPLEEQKRHRRREDARRRRTRSTSR